MAMALDILDEIGQTYGPTRKLHQALANLVAATIENLERSRNGTRSQVLTFPSAAQSLLPPPSQLPVRIDPNLRFESLGTPQLPPASTPLNPSSYQTTPRPSVLWKDPGTGQMPPASESQTNPNAGGEPNRPDPTRITPSGDGLEDSMLWTPNLEWAGGWDDFLNAIAM